jgi:oligopeptide transport system ATP-binding protein
MTIAPMLSIRDLGIEITTKHGRIQPVRGVNLDVGVGETVALVGESGSGKSLTARAIMGILDRERVRVSGGQIVYKGQNLVTLEARARRRLCAEEIGMVFQDPLSALNPSFTVGFQLGELFRIRRDLSRRESRRRSAELLDLVGMPNARTRLDDYPHQFSGGMRQRVVIAMALALEPSLLIADEPTTALDVTVQAVIMDLLADVCRDRGMGLLLITHDLGIVSAATNRVAVMYAGRIVETGNSRTLLEEPAHPYTRGLLQALPSSHTRAERLTAIAGMAPEPSHVPPACPFHPRCPSAIDICRLTEPEQRPVGPGHLSACHRAEEVLVGAG